MGHSFCPAEQQPKAFPETEAGVTGDSVFTIAGAKPARLLDFLLHAQTCVLCYPAFPTLNSFAEVGVDRSCYRLQVDLELAILLPLLHRCSPLHPTSSFCDKLLL